MGKKDMIKKSAIKVITDDNKTNHKVMTRTEVEKTANGIITKTFTTKVATITKTIQTQQTTTAIRVAKADPKKAPTKASTQLPGKPNGKPADKTVTGKTDKTPTQLPGKPADKTVTGKTDDGTPKGSTTHPIQDTVKQME